MQYRKKPVVIDAVQFDGTPGSALDVFDEFDIPGAKFKPTESLLRGVIIIPTLEGHYTASAGDWIIRGVAGEFYPCKPDIFEKTYELVGEVKAKLPSEAFDMSEELDKVEVNAVQCLKCGDVIESTHRHDYVTCKCGLVSVDGGKDYRKRSGPVLEGGKPAFRELATLGELKRAREES